MILWELLCFYNYNDCCTSSVRWWITDIHDSCDDSITTSNRGLFGIPTGFVLRKIQLKSGIVITLVIGILLTSIVGNLCNTYLMPIPLLNFMLMGMAFSGAFSNWVSEEKLVEIINDFQVIQAFAMVVVIINLGAPLDFHAIFGAGFLP